MFFPQPWYYGLIKTYSRYIADRALSQPWQHYLGNGSQLEHCGHPRLKFESESAPSPHPKKRKLFAIFSLAVNLSN